MHVYTNAHVPMIPMSSSDSLCRRLLGVYMDARSPFPPIKVQASMVVARCSGVFVAWQWLAGPYVNRNEARNSCVYVPRSYSRHASNSAASAAFRPWKLGLVFIHPLLLSSYSPGREVYSRMSLKRQTLVVPSDRPYDGGVRERCQQNGRCPLYFQRQDRKWKFGT